MKRFTFLILMLLILCGVLYAQDPQMSIQCSPSEIFVNNLSTATFDPINPQGQPILTTITIQNLIQHPYLFKVDMLVKWNDITIVDNVSFDSREQLQPSNPPLVLTNRDFITQNESAIFDAPDGDVSISSIIDASSVLRNAVQSGFFPDGVITFEFKAHPILSPPEVPVTVQANFIVRIKNITNIFLTYPGVPVGENPPTVSARPVTFMWNAMSTAYNRFSLVINEFPANRPPDAGTVETSGRSVFSRNDLQSNIFSDFLPFQEGYYYAWQVSTGIIDENNPVAVSGKQESSSVGILKSQWYVFRYTTDFGATDSYYQQLLAYLNMMNNPVIQNVFAQGYRITGAVFSESQAYTGADAVDLVKPLVGKEIEVEFNE
jgi:hypothetical protein